MPVGGVDQAHVTQGRQRAPTGPVICARRAGPPEEGRTCLDGRPCTDGVGRDGSSHEAREAGMGEDVAGTGVHARAAPALPGEGAPVPRRVRADAGRSSSFDFERPMTGLEIELNLVDEDSQPAHGQRRGAGGASPTPTTRPSWAATTSSSTCRRGRCPATPLLELEDDAARLAEPRRGAGQRDRRRTSS